MKSAFFHIHILMLLKSDSSIWYQCLNHAWWRHQMEHFSRYWPFMRRTHRSPVNSRHKGQWRRAFVFSLIWTWTKAWANNRNAGYLRRHCTRYDVTVMIILTPVFFQSAPWVAVRARKAETASPAVAAWAHIYWTMASAIVSDYIIGTEMSSFWRNIRHCAGNCMTTSSAMTTLSSELWHFHEDGYSFKI